VSPGPTASPPTASGSFPDAFDPKAPCTDSWGIRYPSFKAFLCGQPFQDDRCNDAIEALRKKGRSQAFCKTFAEGYRGTPEAHRSPLPLTYEPNASLRGWRWASEQGLVEEHAYSFHNIRLGYGYDAARRAAEQHPGT
jgi:hypothetical protein